MSKRDYIELAKVLSQVKQYPLSGIINDQLDENPEWEQPYLAGVYATLDRVVNMLCVVLSDENPQFDAKRFRKAIYG